jgi:hypothetical protein
MRVTLPPTAKVFGAAPTAATKDAVLVEYFGSRLPGAFVLLLWPPTGFAQMLPCEL